MRGSRCEAQNCILPTCHMYLISFQCWGRRKAYTRTNRPSRKCFNWSMRNPARRIRQKFLLCWVQKQCVLCSASTIETCKPEHEKQLSGSLNNAAFEKGNFQNCNFHVIHFSKTVLRACLYRETLSRVGGSPAYPGYPGRATFSYFLLQNAANCLYENLKVGSVARPSQLFLI